MSEELGQLCKQLGLRLFDMDVLRQESDFISEAQGVKFRVTIPHSAIPRDVMVILFRAGMDHARHEIRSKFEDFTKALGVR